MNQNLAIAIKTNNRYFSNKTDKRIQTARSISAAKLFPTFDTDELQKIEKEMKKKGYKTTRVIIGEMPVNYLHQQKSIFEEIEREKIINTISNIIKP